jgi:hypothetical protein
MIADILAVTPERATINIKGLYRVHVPTTGEVIEDFVPAGRAGVIVAEHNADWPSEPAKADAYEALFCSPS